MKMDRLEEHAKCELIQIIKSSNHDYNELMKERKDYVAENKRLREALEKYGEHLDICGVRWTIKRPKCEPCDCGLATALKQEQS